MRIPSQEGMGTAAPQVNTVAAPRRSTAGSDALARLSQIGADTAQVIDQNNKSIQVAGAVTGAKQQIVQYQQSLEHDVDFGTQESRFSDLVADLKKGAEKQFKGNQRLISSYEQSIDGFVFDQGLKIKSAAQTGQIKSHVRTTDSMIEQQASLVANAVITGDQKETLNLIQEGREFIAQAVESGILTKPEAAERMQNFDREIDTFRIENDLNGNPLGVLEELKSGGYKNLIPAKRIEFALEAQSRIAKADTSMEKTISDIDINIAAAKNTNDLDLLALQVDSVFFGADASAPKGTKRMTGSERAGFLKRIGKKKEALFKSDDFLRDVAVRLNGDDSVLIDSAEFNKQWPTIEKNLFSDTPPEMRNAAISTFIQRIGQVPASLKKQITNDIMSSDPQLIIRASDMVSRLNNKRGLVDVFSKKELAFVSQLNTLMQYNSPKDSVKIALESVNPENAAVIEQRRSLLKAEKINFDDRVESVFDGLGFELDGLNKGVLSKDYASLTESYFIAGMNLDSAKDQAEADMRKVWGRDKVTNRFMKYPPHDFYQVNGRSDYVKKQLDKDIQEIGGNYNKIFLTSDDQTSREATTGQPSYLVWGVTDSGIEPIFFNDKKRARFKPDKQVEQGRVRAANKQKMIKAREKMETPLQAANRRSGHYRQKHDDVPTAQELYKDSFFSLANERAAENISRHPVYGGDFIAREGE